MKNLKQRSFAFGAIALAFSALSACEPINELPDGGASADSCGGLLGRGCAEGMFCNYAPTAQCGAADQTGTCEAIPEVCTAIYAPVCGCDDKTYASECEANAHGVSVAAKGECDAPAPGDAGPAEPPPSDAGLPPDDTCSPPPGQVDGSVGERACGGLRGLSCVAGEFCDYGAICSSAADGTGICRPQPEVCTEQYAPVCGCDEKTYGNACQAHANGVSILHDGECEKAPPPSDKICGGFAGLRCGPGEFCDYGATCSSIADGAGVCKPQPELCTELYAPVCGCDDKTYGNACQAHSRGVSILHEGECKTTPAPGKTCGGIAALTCERGQFCNYEPPVGQGCDGRIADAAGACEAIPDACTLEYAPVCGCDQVTYSNRCAAHAHGVSVASKGACKPAR